MDKNKVVMLFGTDAADGKYFDGKIEGFGDAEDKDLHISTLLEIVHNYFSEDPILTRLNIHHPATVAAYFMVELGHIVFLNTTSFEKELLQKHGKSGILMVPDNITYEQFESLKSLLSQLDNYTINVSSDFKFNEGFLESKSFTLVRGMDKQLILDRLSSKIVNPTKH